MVCKSCGGRKAAPSATPSAAPAMSRSVSSNNTSAFSGPDFVEITYNGPVGNHMVLSPRRFFKNYGMHTKGDTFRVHVEDQKAAPIIFVLNPVAPAAAPVPEAPKAPDTDDKTKVADDAPDTVDNVAPESLDEPQTDGSVPVTETGTGKEGSVESVAETPPDKTSKKK